MRGEMLYTRNLSASELLTTDIWTSDSSSQRNDFISLTAYGINANFEYKNYCLEVLPFNKPNHSGEAFQDWSIQDRVREVVTENAPNMGVAIREIQETYNIVPVKCLSHSLQLVIRDSLFIEDKVNEVSTRWNSTLQALRRLLEQRVSVQTCLPRINCRVELTTEEWILMEEVVNILRYFEEATKSISKATATLPDAIPIINSLRKLLDNMSSHSTERQNISQSQKLASDLLLALNERFEGLENEEIYSLATTLDPRYKTRTFQLQSTTSTTATPGTSSEMPTSCSLWSICENIIREAEENEPLSTLNCNSHKEVERYLRSPNISRLRPVCFLA
ncbi:zinc finger BED domain-containing protein 4-like [Vanessa tameamea]|uniref:Zinc finger BED domain-containing protein 4-like n=1 Tax=Vanessa tameamea TaxID=334116 RepID=A0ABM4AN69_VANTA